jgi:hypothetical protein
MHLEQSDLYWDEIKDNIRVALYELDFTEENVKGLDLLLTKLVEQLRRRIRKTSDDID